jgi:hypothetical protein
MQPQNVYPRHAHGLSRRDLLKTGLAAGAALSTWSPYSAPTLWGEEAEPPKRGGAYACADGIPCTSIPI